MSRHFPLFTADDLTAFKLGRLKPILAYYPADGVPDDDTLLEQLNAAAADVEGQLKVRLQPTTFFPDPPSQAEIDALPETMQWEWEPGQDYRPEFFGSGNWGWMVLRHKPVISIEFIRFAYPNPGSQNFTIPSEWIRFDPKYAQVNLVPNSASFTAPLTAFAMQMMAGGGMIPFALQIKYVAGLTGVKTDPVWGALRNAILMSATASLLEIAAPPQSGSISADGLSQSVSMDPSKYREMVDKALFGPKGANGGLWTQIHGIGGTIMGGVA